MLKRLIVVAAMILAAIIFWYAPARAGVERSVASPIVIKGAVFDTAGASVTVPLFLRLSAVEENGIVGGVVKETNYSTGEGVLTAGSFYFTLDPKTFEPATYSIESLPFVSDPESYLGGYITFVVGWEGTNVSFLVETTFVRVAVDFLAFPAFIPSEGGELTYGFWVEGNNEDLDVRVRVGDLSETGYPASKEVKYEKLYSTCHEYVKGSVTVSGKLPNGKSQCVHVYINSPDNFERVLAWTQFCVPKLPVSATEIPAPVDEPKG